MRSRLLTTKRPTKSSHITDSSSACPICDRDFMRRYWVVRYTALHATIYPLIACIVLLCVDFNLRGNGSRKNGVRGKKREFNIINSPHASAENAKEVRTAAEAGGGARQMA